MKKLLHAKNTLMTLKQMSLVSAFVLLVGTGASFASANQSQTEAVQGANKALVEVHQDDPYKMIEQAASRTFARIKAEKRLIQQDPENLRIIMEEELMPYIDYRFSAFKVLGKYTRQVEKRELHEFISVFREYLITTYAVAMGYYDDQEVSFDPARDFSGRTDVTVRAVIVDDVRPEIKVAFKVRKDSKSGDWQTYDMVAEGISLLSSKQSEFESILRKDGIERVIELMRERIRQPIVIEGSTAVSQENTGDSAK